MRNRHLPLIAAACLLTAQAAAVAGSPVRPGPAPRQQGKGTPLVMPDSKTLLAIVRGAPADGIVLGRVRLPASSPRSVVGAKLPDGRNVPAQYVPDAGSPGAGVLVLRLPGAGDGEVTVTMGGPPGSVPTAEAHPTGSQAALLFDSPAQGGLPSAILFTNTGARFARYTWGDRLHDPATGSWSLGADKKPAVQVLANGPICSVVRVTASYSKDDGSRPPSAPQAVYDWYVFRGSPLVYVSASLRQKTPFTWAELHFLELNFAGQDFTGYVGGDPEKSGTFTATKTGFVLDTWGALTNGKDAIGVLTGPVRFYDGRGEYGTYINAAWETWSDTTRQMGAWLWVGADDPRGIRRAAEVLRQSPQVVLTTPAVHRAVAAARDAASGLTGAARRRALWMAALARQAEERGEGTQARALAKGQVPAGWLTAAAGDFGICVATDQAGIALASLYDQGRGRELLAARPAPLFEAVLRNVDTRAEATVRADSGWRAAQTQKAKGGLALRWAGPIDARLAGITVTATASADSRANAWRWSYAVHTTGTRWTVMRATFPQVSVGDLGERGSVIVPCGPGEEHRNVWRQAYNFHGAYPSGWCAMQLLAAYGAGPGASGIYVGLHDPWGSTKDIDARSDTSSRSLQLSFTQPAPDMTRAGNGFTLSGEAVWQLLRGDWYDAGVIYRAWARAHAKWWPKLGPGGREDTPLWMRELSAWALGGGAPSECVDAVKRFAEYLGPPVGFHWYNWHQIPFDNDYPHYFPTKPGFAQGVAELQKAGVRVMPYINGRLWDTRDRGLEDWQFSSVARPAVTKDESGKPYTESYGSRESDGSRVVLGVMCPTTELWQRTVRETVLRIMTECGTSGVYIDQIAAAAPVACMDPSHGHPLGGGHWWNEGYWRLLDLLRKAKPADRMTTTECNAEPFISHMDGYLTWHWQNEGMVPLFPAVYGGAIQMFGRSYGGGPTHDLALRMKAGQQLVFGEQIGWIDPGVVKETANAAFLREVVHLRRQLARFFYAGEMARPPRLLGQIPTVRADWQWSGEHWVSGPAVLTGAWKLPRDRKVVFVFANVSGQFVTARMGFTARDYGIPPTARGHRLLFRDGQLERVTDGLGGFVKGQQTFSPHEAFAVEWEW